MVLVSFFASLVTLTLTVFKCWLLCFNLSLGVTGFVEMDLKSMREPLAVLASLFLHELSKFTISSRKAFLPGDTEPSASFFSEIFLGSASFFSLQRSPSSQSTCFNSISVNGMKAELSSLRKSLPSEPLLFFELLLFLGLGRARFFAQRSVDLAEILMSESLLYRVSS